jgi:hypothetical protein
MAEHADVLRLVPGVFVSLLGLAMAVAPYRVARFQEQLDAIGSKRRREDVEPADWNVQLNRILGVVVLLFGLSAGVNAL